MNSSRNIERYFIRFAVPIQRYDFFRYLAIYHLGGFYFDMDVFLASGLSDLLDFGCVFPFEELTINMFLREQYGMDWEIGNYAFGAAAGHPFIHAIIKNCVKAQRDPEVGTSYDEIDSTIVSGSIIMFSTPPGRD